MNAFTLGTVLWTALIILSGCGGARDYYEGALRKRFVAIDRNLGDGRGFIDDPTLYAGNETYVQRAYLRYFQATSDTTYLHKLVDHADRMLRQRDDAPATRRRNYRGESRATWANALYTPQPIAFVVDSALIVTPLAELVRAAKEDPALAAVPLPDGRTVGAVTASYVARLEETIAAHDDDWNEVEGTYRFPVDADFITDQGNSLAGREVAFNMMHAMGIVYWHLYAATGKRTYRERAEKMARHFKKHLRIVDGAYVWDYWRIRPNVEDVTHAVTSVEFVRLAHAAGLVFDDEDLQRFGRTFSDKLLRADGCLNNYVDGTSPATTYRSLRFMGLWLFMADVAPEAYRQTWRFFTPVAAEARFDQRSFLGYLEATDIFIVAELLRHRRSQREATTLPETLRTRDVAMRDARDVCIPAPQPLRRAASGPF